VVLRKAATPDYGVELGGGMKTERLQVPRGDIRKRPDTAQRLTRSRCGSDLVLRSSKQLRTLLSKSGGGIEIEHALPVGATPLKTDRDPKRLDETAKARL